MRAPTGSFLFSCYGRLVRQTLTKYLCLSLLPSSNPSEIENRGRGMTPQRQTSFFDMIYAALA